jgi:gamma-glutamylcyclotransferase (GGCT)/AIG2-like uncharacterized protein YtfP
MGLTNVFVYGTLKYGFHNYMRYLALSVARGGAELVGTATTVDNFALVVRESGTRAPVMLELRDGDQTFGQGRRISGELYRADEQTLAALDILEGVSSCEERWKSGRYYRHELLVEVEPGLGRLRCFTYCFPSDPELLALDHHGSYTMELHSAYAPPATREDILKLMGTASASDGNSS